MSRPRTASGPVTRASRRVVAVAALTAATTAVALAAGTAGASATSGSPAPAARTAISLAGSPLDLGMLAGLPSTATSLPATGDAAAGRLSIRQLVHLRRVLGDRADPRLAGHPIASALDPDRSIARRVRALLMRPGTTAIGRSPAPNVIDRIEEGIAVRSLRVTAGRQPIDARGGQADVTVRVRLTSRGRFVDGVVDLMPEEPDFGVIGQLFPVLSAPTLVTFDQSNRISGTSRDGTYVVRLELPRYARHQVTRWRVGDLAAEARDGFFYASAYGLQGYPAEVTARHMVDRTGPTLADLTLDSATVRADSSTPFVTGSYNLKDAQSGVADGFVSYRSPSGHQFAYVQAGQPSLKRGSALVHQVGEMFFPPQAETGTWQPDDAYLADQVGNVRILVGDDIGGAAAPVQVMDAHPDTTPPTLLALAPRQLTLHGSDPMGSARLQWTASDAGSGVADVGCNAVGPLDPKDGGIFTFELGGDAARPGTTTGRTELSVEPGSVPGIYHIGGCFVDDAAGNEAMPGLDPDTKLPNQVDATVLGPPALLFHPRSVGLDAVSVRAGTPRVVQIAGRDGIPAGARAVVVAATLSGLGRPATLTAGAAGAARNSAVVAAAPGRSAVGTATLPLSATGALALHLTRGAGTAALRIEGFYAQGRPGNGYHTVATTPLVTGPSFSVRSGAGRAVRVTGVAGASASDVRAVTLAVTATGPTADAVVRVGTGPATTLDVLRVGRGAGGSGTAYVRPDASGMVRVRISAGQAHLRVRVLGWYAPMTVPRGAYFHAAFGRAAYLADNPPLGPTPRYISGGSYWDPLGEGAGVAPHASGVVYSAAVQAPRHTGLLCLSGIERSTPCVGTLLPAGRSAVTSLPVAIDGMSFSRTRLRGSEAGVRFVVQGYFAAA